MTDHATAQPRRPRPWLTPHTKAFWTRGADGELVVKRCPSCEPLLHPSQVVCPQGHDEPLVDHVTSGRGHVIGLTVNHQHWLPQFPPPYVVAVVALIDDPQLRLTTNIVNCAPEVVQVGTPVRVTFAHQDNVWIPLFEPDPLGDKGAAPVPDLPRTSTRAPAAGRRFEEKVALTGIGMSPVGRRLGRPPMELAVQAARAAVEDAGLRLEDIDGLSTYPGGGGEAAGVSEGGITSLEEALRIRPTWINGGDELPGQTGAVVAAMLAVAAGLCRHVLCVRTVWESTRTDWLRRGELTAPGAGGGPSFINWRLPYGAPSAAQWIAMQASQYFHRFGADRRALGWIAVNARTNAALNPAAVYRDPLTMDEYLSARMITTPFGLYDCDVPCDGSVAVVVSAIETAADRRHAPVLVDAVGTGISERQSWDQGTMTHLPNIFGPAAHLWTRASVTRDEVDVALLYDGFSFNALCWLEALGFCDIGEATDYLDEGRRIARDGSLPLNPHGGQLSAGRTHGFGFLHEAVVQLRGDGGRRQIDGARTAVVGVGGGVPAGAFLLRQS